MYLWSPAYLPTEDDRCASDCGNSADLIYSAPTIPTTYTHTTTTTLATTSPTTPPTTN